MSVFSSGLFSVPPDDDEILRRDDDEVRKLWTTIEFRAPPAGEQEYWNSNVGRRTSTDQTRSTHEDPEETLAQYCWILCVYIYVIGSYTYNFHLVNLLQRTLLRPFAGSNRLTLARNVDIPCGSTFSVVPPWRLASRPGDLHQTAGARA